MNRTSDGEVSTSVELKNGHKNLITGERADHQFLTTTADYYKQPDSRPKEAQAGVLTRKRYQDALQEVLDEEVYNLLAQSIAQVSFLFLESRRNA